MIKKIMASLICVVSISVIVGIIIAGSKTYAESTAEPTHNSKYASYKSASFPGSSFADSMTSDAVDGDALNQASASNAYMIPESCLDTNANPNSMIYMKSGSNKIYTINAQVYGAGQASSQYSKYLDSISKCGLQISNATRGSIQYVSWSGGYMMTEGDAIVTILVSDTSKQQSVAEKVMDAIDRKMTETNCLATDANNDSSSRSFYYDQKSYKGLTQQEQVSSTKKTVTLSTPQNLKDAGSIDALYQSPVVRVVPESPLPANMQSSLPSSPQKPTIGSTENTPLSIGTIEYQVKDVNGPGCGWKWSGQQSPTFDQSSLTQTYNGIKKSAISGLDAKVLSYNSWASSYSLSTLWSMRFVNTWNQYTKSVNDITAAWNALDAGRNAFKPTWNAYLQSVYSWETGRLSRQTDQDTWNQTITDCVTDKTNTWKSQQTDTNASPSTDQSNQWKSDCESSNTKPSSLNGDYPSEPTAPAVPSGITIPSSWSTRDDIVKQADASYKAEQASKKAAADAAAKAQADAAAKAKADADAKKKAEEDAAKNQASPSPSPSDSSSSASPSPSDSDSPSPSPSTSSSQ